MDERTLRLKTPADCDAFGRNARKKGFPELAVEALQRKVLLLADAHQPTNEVERDALQAIYAYEEILRERHGRNQRAQRTWGAVGRKGLTAALEGFVDRPDSEAGFTKLKELGLHHFAFEAVVLRHREHFSASAVQRAEQRVALVAD
jgi:hypothetical protein